MRGRFLLLLVICACATDSSCYFRTIDPGIRRLCRINADFGLRLFKEISHEEDGNVFLSPYGVSMSLAMTYLGAYPAGTASHQLRMVTGFGLMRQELHDKFKALADIMLEGSANHTLVHTSAIFAPSGRKYSANYERNLAFWYNSALQYVNWEHTEARRQILNAWADRTSGYNLKDLLQKGDGDHTLKLIDTIYFQGFWKTPFPLQTRHNRSFHVSPGRSIDAEFLDVTDGFNIARLDRLNATMLEMTYIGNGVSMYIIRPDEIDGIRFIETNLTLTSLTNYFDLVHSRNANVRVVLPVFQMTDILNLTGHLVAMGLKDMFLPNRADFSNMDGTRSLYFSNVMQEIRVDNSGETSDIPDTHKGAIFSKSSLIARKEFILDRPFFVLIRHKITGALICIGRVNAPAQIAQPRSSNVKSVTSSVPPPKGDMLLKLVSLLLHLVFRSLQPRCPSGF